MIPNSGEISLNAIMVELGYSSGTEKEIGALCDELDDSGSGAGHSADSFFNCGGFDENKGHFLDVLSAEDSGTDVRITVENNAMVDTFSGTLYYEIYDSSDQLLLSGSLSYSNITAGNNTYMDAAYSAGTPSYVNWRWVVGLSWNTIGVTT